MERLAAFFRRRRLALAAVLVAAVCAAIALWAGYDLAGRVDDQARYEILNDSYSQIIEIPAGGALEQRFPLAGDKPLYGVRLDFATYNHAFQSGTLTAELLNESGDVVATGALDCVSLKDNTFAAVIFDEPYTSPLPVDYDNYGKPFEEVEETLTLRLRYTTDSPADAGCPLGIWASEGTVAGMPLTAVDKDGRAADRDASAAFQYVVDWSGHWSWVLSAILGLLLGAAVVAGFVLLARRVRLWVVTLACGLLLGTAFSFATPPLVAPDEYTHLAYAYQTVSEYRGTFVSWEDWRLVCRLCDFPYFTSESGEIGIFAYKTMLSHLGDHGYSTDTGIRTDAGLRQTPLNYSLYLGQIAGVDLARQLGLGFHAMLLMARLFNLLIYLALATAAVAVAPAAVQGLFACVALLPMPLQLGGSLSPDAPLLGLAFAFTALCLALRERPATRRRLALLAVLTVWLAPAKAIYLPLVLLLFAVPAGHLLPARPGARVQPGTLLRAGLLAAACVGWAAVNTGAVLADIGPAALLLLVAGATAAALFALVYWKLDALRRRRLLAGTAAVLALCAVAGLAVLPRLPGGLSAEQLAAGISANGDSIYTFTPGYLLRNLPAAAKLLLRSIGAQGALWLQGVLGTALGEPIVYDISVSWLLGVGLVLALLAGATPAAGEPPALGRRSGALAGGITALVLGLNFFVALSWTPINYTAIFGVQGRYWLPVLPLALLLWRGRGAPLARQNTAGRAVFAMLCLTSLVILQGAGLYAAAQVS